MSDQLCIDKATEKDACAGCLDQSILQCKGGQVVNQAMSSKLTIYAWDESNLIISLC